MAFKDTPANVMCSGTFDTTLSNVLLATLNVLPSPLLSVNAKIKLTVFAHFI